MSLRILIIVMLCGSTALAQRGDRRGETQPDVPDHIDVPPAPVLTPAQALKSFRIADGFKIELVASEPLIHDPVALCFDGDGRLWVVEMRGYMPDPDGKGENEPVGRISVLEDTDNDGRMDKSTIFLDGLVQPRAIALVKGGLLVAEPPKLWFVQRHGLKAGTKTLVDDRYAVGGNVEHQPNGLMMALDNWLYNAKSNKRYRLINGKWIDQETEFRGQWGISQDDYGRLYYNTNSDQLRGDYVPPTYLTQNPNHRARSGANERVARDQRVYPIRVTTGVNRGYQKNTLTKEGKLRSFTAACGPVVYRGNQFPESFYGNAFVCEPSANLIKRNILTESDARVSSEHAYKDSEFLASTDERFRPVNLYTAPDGTLYLVDMYRGILQHRTYMTSYLRKQVIERDLHNPVGLGRIYRIVHQEPRQTDKPRMESLPAKDLVQFLAHPNGWWRDTAQRLIIEKNDQSVAPALNALAADTTKPLAQIHALWTLEGLNALTLDTLNAATSAQAAPKVVATAIRVAETFAETFQGPQVMTFFERIADRDDADIQLQLALSLGAFRADLDQVRSLILLAKVLAKRGADQMWRDAAISGIRNNEADLLDFILGNDEPNPTLIAELTTAATRSRNPNSVNNLCKLAESAEPQHRQIILQSMRAVTKSKGFKPFPFPNTIALDQLTNSKDPSTRELARELRDTFASSVAAANHPDTPAAKPLTEEEKKQFELGKNQYLLACMICHNLNGQGMPQQGPPLADSEWVTGSEQRLIRIVLHGLQGPITVNGKVYEAPDILPAMPPMKDNPLFDDEKLAAILTYIRNDWGNQAPAVKKETVAAVRKATADRQAMWSEEELKKIDPPKKSD